MAKTANPEFPTANQILDFIASSDAPAGKREIARAFKLSGADKIRLKALLKDMADEGLIDSAPGRAFHKMGGLPKVTVLRIVEIDGNTPIAIPENWQADGVPPPKLRVLEKGRRGALGVGDRILARTEERGAGHVAHVMKRLAPADEMLLGVVEKDEQNRFWLKPVDRKIRRSTAISDLGEAKPGDLVLAEKAGRPPRITARVTQVLGDPLAPKSYSLIAIHKYEIPNEFAAETLSEAAAATRFQLDHDAREDLRDVPILAIDPADARDHDDAIWAAPDDDPANAGGFVALIAIADVSFYVRPGTALDKEALKRGNSVYFPDRVVPMLPEALSNDVCSLKAGVDRAALVCHLKINAKGKILSSNFTRAIVRLVANIAYEDAQAAIDGRQEHRQIAQLQPLWDCWRALDAARRARDPLDLDLPEKRVMLDDQGRIAEITLRERLDAHRVVEEFMIAANVAAAKMLEARKSPLIYRVHEVPAREKLMALKDYLATFDMPFALGQVITPGTFNALIAKLDDHDLRPQIMEQILRSQTQAYYGPSNMGHFGLALGSYAHFTSPIRRYADLVVHRALVRACKLEQPGAKTALTEDQAGRLDRIADTISKHERRAMVAERETLDRYVAAHLAAQVGQIFDCRITGVQSFGFFATIENFGGDGLIPVSTLGAERFDYEADAQRLVGADSGDVYAVGQQLKLRLAQADPVSGSMLFELPEGANHLAVHHRTAPGRTGRGPGKKPVKGKRGRPANIRHRGR